MITYQTLGLADGTPRLERKSLGIARFAKKNRPSLMLSSSRDDLHPQEEAHAISGLLPNVQDRHPFGALPRT